MDLRLAVSVSYHGRGWAGLGGGLVLLPAYGPNPSVNMEGEAKGVKISEHSDVSFK